MVSHSKKELKKILETDVMYGDSGKVDLDTTVLNSVYLIVKKYYPRVLEQKIKYEYGDKLVTVEPI